MTGIYTKLFKTIEIYISQISEDCLVMVKEKNWYILYVMGGKEKKICDFLAKEADWEVFTPFKEVVHKVKGERVIVKKLLFPSYVFIETALMPTDFRQKILSKRLQIQGILRELKYEEDVSALTEKEQTYLSRLMNNNKVVSLSKGEIIDGKVMIIEGPLIGYESYIKKIDRHKRRAILEVEINGNIMEVNVSLEIVKKIESEK